MTSAQDISPRIRLGVVGWRFFPHSYALVNQWQLAELTGRDGWAVSHRDAPFPFAAARPVTGLMDSRAEERIRAIARFAEGDPVDYEYRITYPFDFRPSRAPLAVFMTCESGAGVDNVIGADSFAAGQRSSGATIITPSQWSKSGLIRCGGDPDRIQVVPLGFDPATFRPATPEVRDALRQAVGFADRFVFLNVSSMTGNKGLQPLLRGFAAVAGRHPEAILLLKGVDNLYRSRELVSETISALGISGRQSVLDRIRYLGETMSLANMVSVYQAADAYVSPYFCEGFNLPVLEAAACGLPIITTRGGPTDDFTDPSFTKHIASSAKEWREPNYKHVLKAVHPDEAHLAQHMTDVIRDDGFRRAARDAAVAYVNPRFTWKTVVDQLVAALQAMRARV